MSSGLNYQDLKSPLTAQMEVTYRCTSKCSYCYNSWRGKKDPCLSEINQKEAFNIANKLVDAEVFEVVLTGGEPLLRRDVVYPVANYLSSKNVDVGLNSNLILLKEEDISKIKDSGISRVFSSLPSCDESLYKEITGTNCFRKVVKNIESLVNERVPLGVNMVVVKQNKHQVYDVGKFLSEIGVKYFSATPASPCDYMPRELELSRSEVIKVLDDLLDVKRDFGISVDVVEPLPRCITNEPEKYEYFFKRDCAAGKSTIAISSSGKVRPCTHISEEYGDLKVESLTDIWKRLKSWRDGRYVPKECNLCEEKILCSFGCRESAKRVGGDYSCMELWAEGPIRERRVRANIQEIQRNAKLRVVPNLRFRKEDRGYFIFSPRDHSAIYSNEELFKAILYLIKKGEFSFEDIEKTEPENKDKWLNIIKYLNNKGFIK